MSGIRDTATVTLNINGAQAKQMMSDIEQKVSDTKKKISDLKAAMADPKDIEKARKELKSYERQLDEVRSATQGVESALGNIDSATPRQLEKALRTLNRQLKDMPPGSETWGSHIEKIKELKARLAEIKDETNEQKSLWSKFKDWAMGAWPAIDLLGQWGSGFMDAARKAVEAFSDMDQEMANVRKFTGMTSEEVDKLNESLKGIDTRTSREDLNKLAQEAGRLGKTSQADVLGFVRAADKINVALDDLGEGATLTLSKLTGIFGDEQRYGTEQSLLKVGSVINELSQNCAASAPYLAEFASRMGGVGAQAGMTIQQIMGFAAVLDSNEQKVEASSTALSQVIVRMMQDPAKYARVAGLDVQKFTTMLKEDANGALLLFLETLQKAGGMDVLSPMFKDMGENGSRAIAALSTLATHIDEVKAQQNAANVAFKEGTSIDKEFNVQNTTVQASLEKAKKAVNEIRVELGQKLAPIMSHVISSSTVLLRVLTSMVRFLVEHRTAIISITAGIAAYTVAVNLAAIKTAYLAAETKLFNAFMAAQRLVIIAATAVWSLLTGNITKATAAFRLFSTAIKANPIGLAVSLITTAVVAIGSWINKTNEAKKAEAELAKQREEQAREFRNQITDTSKKSADYANGELDRLKKLYKATQDQTKSYKQRLAAVVELQKTYPSAFGNLSKEQILAGNAATAYNNLAKNIIKAARAKAAAEKIKENEKLILELEMENQTLNENIDYDAKMANLAQKGKREAENKAWVEGRNNVSGASRKTKAEIIANDNILKKYNARIDENSEKLETNRIKLDELNKANQQLAKTAANADKFVDDIHFNSGGVTDIPTATGSGYASQGQAEKDAKKAKAAARAAAVQAKKEFKEQLDQIKAARDKEHTQIETLRMMGEINYLEYNKRKLAADEKYYDDSITLYQKWGIQEDDQCQALARKREEFLSKANEQRLALNKEAIQRVAQAEERDLKARYASKSSHTLAEELQLEEELLTIRYNALMDQQALYKKTDKEYEDYQRQIDDLFLKDQEEKQKKLLAKVEEFRRRFDYQPVKVKYDMERAALEELYRLKKIKEEDYQKWLKKLNEAEAEEKENELPGKKPENAKTNAAAVGKNFNDEKQKLDAALAAGDINENEYKTRLGRMEADLRKSLIAPLRECKSEWVSMTTTMVESWMEFAEALKDPEGNPLGALGSAIESTGATAIAVMSMVTEFQQAELEIQTAAINKRYDAEISRAEGNTYQIKKLEKQRDAEQAKAKKEANRKMFAMQIIQAVAQTATNALNAYGSAAAIPVVGYILAPIAAAMAVAAGAIQIAAIKKQQQASESQGYSKGGFTRPGRVDEPAGVVHAGEWVASQKLLASPVARPMIEALDYAQRTNTIGSLRSEDVSRSIRANDSLARAAENNDGTALMVAAMARNAQVIDALDRRLEHPIGAVVTVTGEHGINAGLDEYQQYISNKNPKSRK